MPGYRIFPGLVASDGLVQSAPPAETVQPLTPFSSSSVNSTFNPPNEDQPPGLMSAWFVGASIGVVDPSFTRLTTSGPMRQTFLGRLHSFDLDWTVAPEVVFGYRWESGAALVAAYSNLTSRGTHGGLGLTDPIFYTALQAVPLPAGQFLAPDAAGNNQITRGRLEENWLNLDFSLPRRFLAESLWWRCSVGLRMAILYANFTSQYDFKANLNVLGAQTITSLPFSVTQGATHQAFALGPHVGLEGAWPMGASGFALVGRGDVGILGAANRQNIDFAVSAQMPGTGASTPTFTIPSASTSGPGYVTTLNLEGGLNWKIVLARSSLDLSLGYAVNSWMFTATGDGKYNALFSDINRLSHGPFFRALFEF